MSKRTPRQMDLLNRAAKDGKQVKLEDSYDVRSANTLEQDGFGQVSWSNFQRYFYINDTGRKFVVDVVAKKVAKLLKKREAKA